VNHRIPTVRGSIAKLQPPCICTFYVCLVWGQCGGQRRVPVRMRVMPHLLDDLLGRAAVRQDFINAPLLQPIRMSRRPLRVCAPFDRPDATV